MLGKEKEEKAAAFLISKGYKILEKNYLRKTGEIDIIAKSADGYLTAVEVNTGVQTDLVTHLVQLHT